MKKLLVALVALLLVVSMLAVPALGEDAAPLDIVCTTFPQYDWVMNILGDRAADANVTLLLDSGVDLHSYQPTAEDIAAISAADLFIYVGGESDAWVESVFASLGDQAPRAIALTDLVDARPEEIVEGMEHVHEDEHGAEIFDRPLSDWFGSWQSVLPYVEDGSLKEFLSAKAEDNGETVDEARERYMKQYASPYRSFEIDEGGVRFVSDDAPVEAEYAYAGYRAVESDHGTSVWYVFESTAEGDAPKYIAFNDHGTGGDDHDDDHDEGPAHFHMRYGPEGPDALAEMTGWGPTFFDAAADVAAIDDVLSGHDHGHEGFDEEDVEDRALADFSGEWQSIYPYMLDGTMDEALKHIAEEGDMALEELSAYYASGFETDIDRLVVGEDSITFRTADGETTIAYAYDGFVFLRYEDMDAQSALYRFRATDDVDGALRYVLFADHNYKAGPAEHFHLNFSEDGNITVEQTLEKFATYFPASFTGEEIAEEMMAHGDSDHDHNHDHDHDHEGEYDEHVWLSLRFAQKLVRGIADALAELDAANAETYRQNADAYIARLDALDSAYQVAVGSAARKTVLFADRFPFRYLADDYGLRYYAAFSGCSAETEASFETVAFLADKLGELELNAVLTIEGGAHKIADTVIANSDVKDAKILVLNSLQSITAKDLDAGVSYLDVMEQNLAVLTEALN